ncbi:MAG: TIGR02391 family protein [SAR324 cluster bacterium]|nr:TIGR02391 family protein [SAR324 cluster bacterium]
MEKMFTQSQLEAIAQALADTEKGLTGSEIGHILASLRMADPDPSITKWKRLYNAFVERQNGSQNRRAILQFIREALKPERYAREAHRFEPMRANVNRALAFVGLALNADGTLVGADQVGTLSEAQRRANELRADLTAREIHPEVLEFCREELVADNYFHAVLEATKSVADKLRSRTALTDDGVQLVDKALAGDIPLLAINALSSESERSEQRGFANLVRGIFGMFRNPTAHTARIHWMMNKKDAEDLLSVVSLIHRRLDNAQPSVGA